METNYEQLEETFKELTGNLNTQDSIEALYYLINTGSDINEIFSEGVYHKDVVDRYYENHHRPSRSDYVESLKEFNKDIDGIQAFLKSINYDIGKDKKYAKKKSKGKQL